MAELGESVGIGVVKEWEDKCPFAHNKSKGIKNELDKSSAGLGTALKNGTSTKLWVEEGDQFKLKEKQKLRKTWPRDDEIYPEDAGQPRRMKKRVVVRVPPYQDREGPYSGSAHHVIPTNASLMDSPKLLQFVKTGEKISGNIGYDTNGAENGLWLPTGTALMRVMNSSTFKFPGVVTGTPYVDMPVGIKQTYTEAVMKKTNRQFHDAHPEYSSSVKVMLGKLANYLAAKSQNLKCPKCKEIVNNDGKRKPPHGLVDRLNSLSVRLQGKLINGPLTWRPPLFTSSSAAAYSARARARERVLAARRRG